MSEGFQLLELVATARNLLAKRLATPNLENLKDLSLREAFVLQSLPAGEPVTPSSVATARGISPSTLSGILDRLEDKGYIVRKRDAEDRRIVMIERCESALEQENAWRRQVEDELMRAVSSMDSGDIENLTSGLQALIGALREGSQEV